MAIKSADQITIVDITDAYSVILTSEAYTFVGGTETTISGSKCTTQAVAFCGSKQCNPIHIGDVTCPTGIAANVIDNDTKSPTIEFTTDDTVESACEATIEVIIEGGITVNKKFSFAVAKVGTSVTVSSTSVKYAVSGDGNSAPTTGWQTTIPTVSNGQYLWTQTIVTYSDGKKTEAYSVSYKGTNGTNGTSVTISSTSVQYMASSNGTTAPTTGTWEDSVPTVNNGQFLWTRTIVTYSDGKSTTSYSVSYKGTNGNDGADAITMTITSSGGTVFKNSEGSTTLTAHVFVGGVEQTVNANGSCGNYGSVKWYEIKSGTPTLVATAKSYTVSASKVDSSLAITAQLEE